MEKSAQAFRTIGEVSEELGLPQHILRYWETRFPQLRPMQRAGNRRYYRPDDVALVRRIHALLNEQGYTVKGVQKLLSDKSGVVEATSPPPTMIGAVPPSPSHGNDGLLPALIAMRDRLARALAEDDVAARVSA
jgi:DNA-binding transcriptional MerR regulator